MNNYIRPLFVVALGCLTGTLSWAHDPILAERDLAKEIAVNGPQVDSLKLRAMTRADQGDLPGALEDFAQALRLQPQAHEIWRMRGMVLADFHRLRAARVDLQRYVAWHTEDGEALWSLALVERDLAGWLKDQDPLGCEGAVLDRVALQTVAQSMREALPLLARSEPQHFMDLGQVLFAADGTHPTSAAIECVKAGLWLLPRKHAPARFGCRPGRSRRQASAGRCVPAGICR